MTLQISFYILLTFLALGGVNADEYFTCHDPPHHLNVSHGKVIIQRNKANCTFETEDGSEFLALRFNQITLNDGDKFEVLSNKGTNPLHTSYSPPLNTGFYVFGLFEPKLIFTFANPKPNSTETYEVEFFQKPLLPVNGDIYNNFQITSFGITSLGLSFNKTIKDQVHIELEGAKYGKPFETGLRHVLLDGAATINLVGLSSNISAQVTTSPVFNSCSASFQDKEEKVHDLIGPVSSSSPQRYQCVNLFHSSEDNGHFDVNFADFLDIADSEDELIIEDSIGNENLRIIKSRRSGDLTGSSRSFAGKELAVIYNSPGKVNPTNIQFKLKVVHKKLGGVVDKAGILTFPSTGGGQIRYVLIPDSGSYAALKILKTSKNFNVSLSTGPKIFAQFTSKAVKLPPIITQEEKNTAIILDVRAEKFSDLKDTFEFKSLAKPCHKVTSDTSGGFSVIGGQGSCIWTLAADSNVALDFSYNDLTPGGCLAIHSLLQEAPIYSQCNLTQQDILPTFILKQAYLNVTLPLNKTRLDASISSYPYNAITSLEPAATIEIFSPGYPKTYALSNDKPKFVLDGLGKNYFLTVHDVDLGSGEKLLVGKVEISQALEDLDISNSTTSITVLPAGAKDFTNHRGYHLTATQFDKILVADLNKNQLTTPKNVTTLLLKISSPGKNGFGKRISYNITGIDKNSNITIFDARSIGSVLRSDQSNGSSTSDTLLLTFKAKAANVKLSELKIDYKTLDCNATRDHICDNATRCVPVEKLCKGKYYCQDGTDLKVVCSSGPAPKPTIISNGVSGGAVFLLSIFMLVLGVFSALYGPNLYKSMENRFRSGQYTTFSSVE